MNASRINLNAIKVGEPITLYVKGGHRFHGKVKAIEDGNVFLEDCSYNGNVAKLGGPVEVDAASIVAVGR